MTDTLRADCETFADATRYEDHASREFVDRLLTFARSQQAKGLREAAEIAKTYGVYPELNIFDGGPGWYQHGHAIAAALEDRARERLPLSS